MFCQIVAAIYFYIAHLTGFRAIYVSKTASQENWTKNSPINLRVFFCDNETARYFVTIASI